MAHAIVNYDNVPGKLFTIAGRFALALDFAPVTRTCVICVGFIFAGAAADADEVKRAEAWFNKIKTIEELKSVVENYAI